MPLPVRLISAIVLRVVDNVKPVEANSHKLGTGACGICMKDFKNGDKEVYELSCSSRHIFHA